MRTTSPVVVVKSRPKAPENHSACSSSSAGKASAARSATTEPCPHTCSTNASYRTIHSLPTQAFLSIAAFVLDVIRVFRFTSVMAINTSLLARICEAPGAPGFEKEIRKLVLEEIKDLADDISVDNMGNVVALKKG